jgi:hypothetical protein
LVPWWFFPLDNKKADKLCSLSAWRKCKVLFKLVLNQQAIGQASAIVVHS